MGQVTSLTAEKSLELADENIVDAVITGGHLILRRRNWNPAFPTAAGTFIDAGSVIGGQGLQGNPGSGSLVIAADTAGAADDPLGTAADTWYTLAGVTATTPALVVGHRYAVDYYCPLTSHSDLTNWDVELLRGGTPVHRANAFAPNSERTVVASGRYYFIAAATTAQVFTMRARSTTASSPASYADNSFISSSIVVTHFVP
jgi:hypothetical protein